MSIEDKVACRLVQRMFSRREALDMSDAKINVQRGIAYISGIVRPQPGLNVQLREEMRTVTDEVRKLHGIHDVVMDARLDSAKK